MLRYFFGGYQKCYVKLDFLKKKKKETMLTNRDEIVKQL